MTTDLHFCVNYPFNTGVFTLDPALTDAFVITELYFNTLQWS